MDAHSRPQAQPRPNLQRQIFPRPSLQRRVGTSMSILMTLLVLSLFRLYYSSWHATINEHLQLRLWPLAGIVAERFAPHLSPIVDELALTREARNFLAYNPTIDIHLLDDRGKIVNQFCNALCISRDQNIPLDPILKLLQPGTTKVLPIYGPDPVKAGRTAVFSAATLSLPGKQLYVYIVLSNVNAENRANKMLIPLAWSATYTAAFLIFLAAMVVGIFIIVRTFAPYRKIMATVQQLERQDYSARAPEDAPGELGALSAAINEMASQVSRHVDELKEKDNRRMELIANIWHDVRAPLTGVSGLSQLLAASGSAHNDPAERKSIISSLVANTKLLGQIVSDLQELGKLEVGDQKPKMQAISLIGVADEIALVFKRKAEELNIQLILDFPDALPAVNADAGMISRVMSNLIENSLRYTPSGGRITFALRDSEEWVAFSVEDTGAGIDPSDLPLVFERRFQSAQGKHGMSGLGLAIVKTIVERHGGTIEVESIPERSTTFEVRLPKPFAAA